MTKEQIKDFFSTNTPSKGKLTSGEISTIMSSIPSFDLKMDRGSQEYYFSIDVSDLIDVKDEHFISDLRTLGFSLNEDSSFIILYV
jgi:hypothetical protein